ncbi:MAG: hypothetical protein HYU77_07250 [Betaproteobacteria bacterium]|nr:hypothetical protein [Betaproteobacteria bacterium]
MTAPRTHIAFAPQGAGLLCALVYLERGDDVYGWFTGARNSDFTNAFFKLQDFYAASGGPVFYATEGMDLYGGWKYEYSVSAPELARPIPMTDDAAHELDRLQDVFTREWLFCEWEPGAAREIQGYRKLKLPVQRINVRTKALNRLDRSDAIWLYRSHDFAAPVLEYLAPRWPLDYRFS